MSQPAASRPRLTDYRNLIGDTRRWDNFQHRPGDIYVCTPPKCGTTWKQTIVAMLLFPHGVLPAPVMHLAPWLDALFTPIDEILASLAAQKHRRSIKTHTPADGIPLLDLMPPEDIHEFFAQWTEEGSLFQFLMTYWEHRADPNVLVVHYDDLKADLEMEFRRIAAFLGIAIDEALLPGILERCSFQWMRSHGEHIGELGELFVGGAESFFYKVIKGRWRDVPGRATDRGWRGVASTRAPTCPPQIEMSGFGPHRWHDGARDIEPQRAGPVADDDPHRGETPYPNSRC